MKPVQLNPVIRQRLEWRLTKKDGCTRQEAKLAIAGMLEYLKNARSGEAPGQLVDKAWHAFILHTPEYREFCLKNFGHFIDHIPVWPPKPLKPRPDARAEAKADCVPDPCSCCKPCGKMIQKEVAALTGDCSKPGDCQCTHEKQEVGVYAK